VSYLTQVTLMWLGQPDCKPGYVGRAWYLRRSGDGACRSAIYLRCTLPYHLVGPCVMTSVAVYPPTMDEQPLDAGILDLATHKACGRQCRHRRRWALASPFHPCLKSAERIPAVIFCHATLPLCAFGGFPLKSMALCVARTFLTSPENGAARRAVRQSQKFYSL